MDLILFWKLGDIHYCQLKTEQSRYIDFQIKDRAYYLIFNNISTKIVKQHGLWVNYYRNTNGLSLSTGRERNLYDKALFFKNIKQSFNSADSSNASRASKISQLET